MEKHLVELAIGAVILAGGVYVAWKYRHQVREKVAGWLRTHGLEQSALMDVLMVCDRVATTVKKVLCKIFVKTQQTGEQKISEQEYTLDELQNFAPDVFAEFQRQGHARKSIMKQVM